MLKLFPGFDLTETEIEDLQELIAESDGEVGDEPIENQCEFDSLEIHDALSNGAVSRSYDSETGDTDFECSPNDAIAVPCTSKTIGEIFEDEQFGLYNAQAEATINRSIVPSAVEIASNSLINNSSIVAACPNVPESDDPDFHFIPIEAMLPLPLTSKIDADSFEHHDHEDERHDLIGAQDQAAYHRPIMPPAIEIVSNSRIYSTTINDARSAEAGEQEHKEYAPERHRLNVCVCLKGYTSHIRVAAYCTNA